MSLRKIALALAMTATGLSAAYAANDAPAAPAEAAAEASMPKDCGKQMARHDHGAEKGSPMSMSAKCGMAQDASTGTSPPVKKAKAKGHDHAMVHKLM